jgi:ATP-grasp domain-containing protein
MLQLSYAFWERGFEVVPYGFEALCRGEIDPWLDRDLPAVTVGHIAAVRRALERAGCPAPELPDFPEGLRPWLERSLERSTLGEVRRRFEQDPAAFPLHVKPALDDRLFQGTLIRAFRDLIPLAAVDPEAEVWVQGAVEFTSEWRAYVLDGEILRVCNYKGDPLQFPNRSVLEAGLAAFSGAPRAYGADWGVTASGRTLLVEVNDAYALGNYGLHGHELAGFMEARWRELTQARRSSP